LGFSALRQIYRAEEFARLLAPRKQSPEVRALLLTALALLSTRQDEHSYDGFTLVNQAVEAAKRNHKTINASGFINACLRRYLRERADLEQRCLQSVEARWNHPRWWVDRVQNDHPHRWQHILEADLRRAPLTLRSRELEGPGPQTQGRPLPASKTGPQAWSLAQSVPPQSIDGFVQGAWSVQDSAAQLAAPLLLQSLQQSLPRSGKTAKPLRILDACAAPGGKTTHLLEWAAQHSMSIEVTALELEATRTPRITENLQRCGVSAKVVTADATQPAQWWDGQPFDGILLDAPCSASGIVRRHPDILRLRRNADITALCATQTRILDALWPLLTPHGTLLYCTCSVFRSEGQEQINAFLARNKQARLMPSPGHLLPEMGAGSVPMPENHTSVPIWGESTGQWGLANNDGFFYALLQHAST
jgi:16S rRNA (cytosine967-C5)-methyltransferase